MSTNYLFALSKTPKRKKRPARACCPVWPFSLGRLPPPVVQGAGISGARRSASTSAATWPLFVSWHRSTAWRRRSVCDPLRSRISSHMTVCKPKFAKATAGCSYNVGPSCSRSTLRRLLLTYCRLIPCLDDIPSSSSCTSFGNFPSAAL